MTTVQTRSALLRSSDETEAGPLAIALVRVSFVALFALLSPLYYLNRWDFKRHTKRNPFYTSKLVRLMERYPLLYELAMIAINFPVRDGIYKVLPYFSGDVLQVGCGTGLLNKFLRKRSDIRFTNMDPNEHSLAWGVRLKRYSSYIRAYIDKPTPLPDCSFDTVVFARCFHHVRNHKKAFQECSRLLRDGGVVIIADPVVLQGKDKNAMPTGYMGNSSIDGVIWRFTQESFVKHLELCLPPALSIASIDYVRQAHVSNYNLFVEQTDVIAILEKRG